MILIDAFVNQLTLKLSDEGEVTVDQNLETEDETMLPFNGQACCLSPSLACHSGLTVTHAKDREKVQRGTAGIKERPESQWDWNFSIERRLEENLLSIWKQARAWLPYFATDKGP